MCIRQRSAHPHRHQPVFEDEAVTAEKLVQRALSRQLGVEYIYASCSLALLLIRGNNGGYWLSWWLARRLMHLIIIDHTGILLRRWWLVVDSVCGCWGMMVSSRDDSLVRRKISLPQNPKGEKRCNAVWEGNSTEQKESESALSIGWSFHILLYSQILISRCSIHHGGFTLAIKKFNRFNTGRI